MHQAGCGNLVASMPEQSLDAHEQAGLAYLRAEEKLARDVYIQLYSKWADRVFGRISQSEQRHFDSIGVLLDRYGLMDPAAGMGVGEFSDDGLRVLYEDLVSQGQASLQDALRVGAMIEDLDMRDLQEALASTDNEDLKIVYQNLLEGSQNHMRAFAGRLAAIGVTYEAQYITADKLEEILSSPQNAGSGMGTKGNGSIGRVRGGGICPWNQNSTVQ